MKLSNVVVMCLSALLGLLIVCFTAIACTMVVNWSVPDDAAILEGNVCSVQAFNSDYAVEPLADGSVEMPYPVEGEPDISILSGTWYLGSRFYFNFVYADSTDSSFVAFPLVSSDFYDCFFRITGYYSGGRQSFYLNLSYFGLSLDVYEYRNYDDSFDRWLEPDYRVVVFDDSRSVASSDVFSSLLNASDGSYKISDDINWTPPPEKGSYIAPFLDVFDGLGVWLITGLNNVIALFWVADMGSLTLLGILAVAALAVSVFFLLMSIIQNFLHFRG